MRKILTALTLTAIIITGIYSQEAVYIDRYGNVSEAGAQGYTRNINGYVIPTVSPDTYFRTKYLNEQNIKAILTGKSEVQRIKIARDSFLPLLSEFKVKLNKRGQSCYYNVNTEILSVWTTKNLVK